MIDNSLFAGSMLWPSPVITCACNNCTNVRALIALEEQAMRDFDLEAEAELIDGRDDDQCRCEELPEDQRQTGHHPNCLLWDQQASA